MYLKKNKSSTYNNNKSYPNLTILVDKEIHELHMDAMLLKLSKTIRWGNVCGVLRFRKCLSSPTILFTHEMTY